MSESYSERLEREIKEMQLAHPGLKEMMEEIRAAIHMTNFEVDYDIERDARAYWAVKQFLDKNYPPCKHQWVRTTRNYKSIKKCYLCGIFFDEQK